MNIWRGPGSICSYGRVVKGSLSVLFINVCNGLCAQGEESTIRLDGRGRTQRLSLNPSILFYEIFIDITLVHKLEGDGLQHLLCPLLCIPNIVTSTSTNLPTTQVFSQIYNNSAACIVPPPRTSWSVPHNVRRHFVLLFYLMLNWSVRRASLHWVWFSFTQILRRFTCVFFRCIVLSETKLCLLVLKSTHLQSPIYSCA